MNWGDYLQYMLALVFVLALIGLIAVGVKRFGIAGTIGGRRTARITVLEAAPVDKRRRLLLIRRDNVEHLVMIGGGQDFVVESGIQHDPANKLDAGSPLRSYEPPLTAREPALQPDLKPKRTRRSPSARDDQPPAEPKLDMPRAASADDQQMPAEEPHMDEPVDGPARTRPPEQQAAEMPAAHAPAPHADGDRRSAGPGGHSSQPDRTPARNIPPTSAPAGTPEMAPAPRETIGGRENYVPCAPNRIEPKLQSRTPNTTADPRTARPEPKAQMPAQPQVQRRPADPQKDRAPAPAPTQASRQTRPHMQAEASQRTRQQAPPAQPAMGQRIEPTIQAPARQPARPPQAVSGNDPDLLILNDPVIRPRRA